MRRRKGKAGRNAFVPRRCYYNSSILVDGKVVEHDIYTRISCFHEDLSPHIPSQEWALVSSKGRIHVALPKVRKRSLQAVNPRGIEEMEGMVNLPKSWSKTCELKEEYCQFVRSKR